MENNNKVKKKHALKSVHATSTISMSLVLFLIGLVSLLFFVTRDLSDFVRENINMSVVLDDQIGESYTQRVKKYLEKSEFTKSVDYVTKEDALKEHIATMGEDPQDFLGFNPLLASLEVKLNAAYANSDSIAMIEKKLASFDHINRVTYQKDLINLVNDNIAKVSIILLSLALILLIVSMTLIHNTIRIAIYSNRFIINTMKLVGATWWFIRKPYIIQSVINGIVAAVLSLIMLSGLMYYIQVQFVVDGQIIQLSSAIMVSLIVISMGILLAAISSFIAVGKYLHMKTDDMYFI